MENIIAVKQAAPITLPLPTGMFEGDGERRGKERRFCTEDLRSWACLEMRFFPAEIPTTTRELRKSQNARG